MQVQAAATLIFVVQQVAVSAAVLSNSNICRKERSSDHCVGFAALSAS